MGLHMMRPKIVFGLKLLAVLQLPEVATTTSWSSSLAAQGRPVQFDEQLQVAEKRAGNADAKAAVCKAMRQRLAALSKRSTKRSLLQSGSLYAPADAHAGKLPAPVKKIGFHFMAVADAPPVASNEKIMRK